MSRTRAFFYNTAATALMQLVTLLAGLITPRVLLTAYGSEINGLVTSVSQFIAYFNLAEAGLAGAAVYALYRPLAEQNHQAVNGIVAAAKKFYTQSGYLFLALTAGLAILYPIYIRSETLPFSMIGLLVLILGTNGAMEFFTLAKYRVLLTADQKTYVIAAATTAEIVLSTVVIATLAFWRVPIVGLRAVCLCALFLRSAILWRYCRRRYRFLNDRVPPDNKSLNKRWDAMFLQILGMVHTGAPVILLTLLLKDLKLVSVFSVYNMVLTGIGGLVGIFISGLSASFGDVIARGELPTLQKAYREFEMAYYAIISLMYGVTFVMIMPFVQLYTAGISDAHYNMPLVGFLMVLNGLLFNIKTPQGMLVLSAGLYRETRYQTVAQGMIAVTVGAALAPVFGLAGIILGSVVSNIYRDLDLMFFIPRHVTKLPVKKTARRILLVFVRVGLIILPFTVIKLEPAHLSSWVLMTCLTALYAALVIAITALFIEREEHRHILKRIRNLKGATKMTTKPQGKENCCGCGACQAVCPHHAVTLRPDEKGFLYPEVSTALCVGCRACVRTCPLDAAAERELSGRLTEPTVYAVKHRDSAVRRSSTSGGMFTALSDVVLEKGGSVYGACFDENFNVCHRRAVTKQVRDAFKGSKYVQSTLLNVYWEVEKDLHQGRTVLFTGTPCQTSALMRFLTQHAVRTERLFICDLVCHGVTSPVIWQAYLAFLMKKFKGRVMSAAFRSKEISNGGIGMKIHFFSTLHGTQDTYQKSFVTDVFFRLYLDGLILRESCHRCRFAGTKRPSDMTIGDFWGIETCKPEFDDGGGVSLVLVQTEKGKTLFEAVGDRIDFEKSNLSECLPRQPQLKSPSERSSKADTFWEEFFTRGLSYVLKKYTPAGWRFCLKKRIENSAYALLKALHLVNFAKKILGRE
ncbi:Coenzyme F420 hydrogenase/dehydrogenase, beta subunit C-terminal domain [Oscillospiraceae bacterium CM]|nr:Coenzyme F420 hydrogenase/dehydrogenase, beta subunit C-terminal domain [Oscillospiraceae bacterium CM]